LPVKLEILDTLIRNQKSAIKYQAFFAVIIIVCGCLLMLFAFYFLGNTQTTDTVKIFVGIGGGFISSISVFPIQQITARIERLRIYNYYELNLDKMSENEQLKVEELITKSIEKIM